MACGCKKKRIDEAERASQQAMTIKLTETPVPHRPPDPIQTPVQEEVENIVNKINSIMNSQ